MDMESLVKALEERDNKTEYRTIIAINNLTEAITKMIMQKENDNEKVENMIPKEVNKEK